ncbi:MAG: type II toxin-antitoxin system Phd/YefM family antitoxin [Lachnospiraceae bacterium]|nr:type II toxin-antitoxin system Phd/YefM family antitoxin [Lachnospiraceae bacterium]
MVESVNQYDEPILIVGKKGNAVLISEDDWNALQETLQLSNIPQMTQSIIEGKKEPFENCILEEKVKF